MSIRHLLATAMAIPLGVFGSAAPAAAHVLAQPDPVGAYTLTAGRFWSLAGALLGLVGLVVGRLALSRPAGRVGAVARRRRADAAVAAGTACLIIGGLVVAAAEGGPGTGYGIVGGFIDLAIGLIAVVLGGVARARSRRTG
ncbi:DUF6223 family protein [Thermostaphylospora chromogena]|jgi:hypothetical protein|uniref:Uncharacterized protein n=1 Tax=Thermostaphylospora chromogena TaxID=35622 RepID=A0A1H1D5Q3_9ACTN|nr:DUF6223 family protein [Thermostaphylospora chromogena]SDQ71857.1 hypothetical protein SAMN04489764_1836 [Thermostaphylospora chromogena]